MLLKENNIDINKERYRELIDLIDADRSGTLSMNEFKHFLFSQKNKEGILIFLEFLDFTALMRRIKEDF